MKSKTLLAAGIIQDLLFRSEESVQAYLYYLDRRYVLYKVLEGLRREDGSIIIRIVKQYNSCDLIQFPEAE